VQVMQTQEAGRPHPAPRSRMTAVLFGLLYTLKKRDCRVVSVANLPREANEGTSKVPLQAGCAGTRHTTCNQQLAARTQLIIHPSVSMCPGKGQVGWEFEAPRTYRTNMPGGWILASSFRKLLDPCLACEWPMHHHHFTPHQEMGAPVLRQSALETPHSHPPHL
jgi:hypothetical protein